MKFRLNVRIVHPADASEATPGATRMEFTLWSEEEKHSIGRVRLAPSIDVHRRGRSFMKPCLAIPIYDHGGTIAEVVESLAYLGAPLHHRR